MSLHPFTRRKLRSAFSMPAAIQRLIIVPSRQRVTLRVVVLPTEIIDPMGLVDVNVLASRSPTPRRRTVNMSSSGNRGSSEPLPLTACVFRGLCCPPAPSP